jgi:hypothetical protein
MRFPKRTTPPSALSRTLISRSNPKNPGFFIDEESATILSKETIMSRLRAFWSDAVGANAAVSAEAEVATEGVAPACDTVVTCSEPNEGPATSAVEAGADVDAPDDGRLICDMPTPPEYLDPDDPSVQTTAEYWEKHLRGKGGDQAVAPDVDAPGDGPLDPEDPSVLTTAEFWEKHLAGKGGDQAVVPNLDAPDDASFTMPNPLANDLTLTDPTAPRDPDAQRKPEAPQLKKLTPEQAAACEQYLTDHGLSAVSIPGPGRSEFDEADYAPMLDGEATSIHVIVRKLGPLTLLNPVDELRALVEARYKAAVTAAINAASARTKGDFDPIRREKRKPVDLDLPPNAKYPMPKPGKPDLPPWLWNEMPKRDNTPEWKVWQKKVEDWCKEHHIDPAPLLDAAKDIINKKEPDDPNDDLVHPDHKDRPIPPRDDPDSETKTGPTRIRPAPILEESNDQRGDYNLPPDDPRMA